MRPIPIAEEILEELNAGEEDPETWTKITMFPPDPSGVLADGTKCDAVEVAVETRPLDLNEEDRAVVVSRLLAAGSPVPDVIHGPRRFLVRVGITTADVEAMQATGAFWLSLWGEGMQPFAVFVDLFDAEQNVKPSPTWVELFKLANEVADISATGIRGDGAPYLLATLVDRARALFGEPPITTADVEK